MLVRIRRVICGTILLWITLNSFVSALSLGNIEVYSYLNEPLAAEIPINELNGEDLGRIQVRLASEKDFARAGIEFQYILRNLLFEIVVYKDQPYIYIRSAKVISDPYLKMLVELEMPDGKFIKDYTILIDPPPPNLTKANHRIAFSQKAIDEAQSKPFGGDEVQAQLATQQHKEQEEKVQQTRQKFSNNVFSDETMDAVVVEEPATPAAAAPVAGTNTDVASTQESELVPGVVPDMTEPAVPGTASAPGSAASPVNSSATTGSTTPATPGLPVNVPITPPAGVVEMKSEVAGSAAAQPGEPVSAVATPEQAEDIDFNEVIKPSTTADPATQPTAEAAPVPAAAPEADAVPPTDGGGNYMYLGFILSLLLVAGGIAISIKRGYHKKLVDAYEHMQQQRKHKENDDAEEKDISGMIISDADQESEADDAEKLINEEFNEQEAVEEIELSSGEIPTGAAVAQVQVANAKQANDKQAAKEPNSKLDLDKFENEFSNLDLDKLAIPIEPTTTPATSRSPLPEEATTKAVTPQIVETPPVVEAPPVELSIDQAEDILAQITHSTRPIKRIPNAEQTNPNMPQVATTQAVSIATEPQMPIANPEPSPTQASPITPETVSLPEPASKLETVVTPEFASKPETASTPELVSKPETVSLPEPASIPESVPTQDSTVAALQPTTIETPVVTEPKVDSGLLGTQDTHLPSRDAVIPHANISTDTDDFTLSGPTLHVEPGEANNHVMPPSLNTAELPADSNLDDIKRLADNREEMTMKINLAKQYIDAGDKESAKSILREVIEVANDQQKLEAEITLSSLV